MRPATTGAGDAARPLAAIDHVVRLDDAGITTRRLLAADEPYFAGHYPGHPIFPGVFIVEAVHQSALCYARARGRRARLLELRSARFLAPLAPGDELECECLCRCVSDGARLEIEARCHGAGTLSAQVRLLYHLEPERA